MVEIWSEPESAQTIDTGAMCVLTNVRKVLTEARSVFRLPRAWLECEQHLRPDP